MLDRRKETASDRALRIRNEGLESLARLNRVVDRWDSYSRRYDWMRRSIEHFTRSMPPIDYSKAYRHLDATTLDLLTDKSSEMSYSKIVNPFDRDAIRLACMYPSKINYDVSI